SAMLGRIESWKQAQEASAQAGAGGAGEGSGGNETGGNGPENSNEQEPLSPEDRLKRAWEISMKLAVIRDRYKDRLTPEEWEVIEAEEVFVIDMLEKYDPENQWAEQNEQVLHE